MSKITNVHLTLSSYVQVHLRSAADDMAHERHAIEEWLRTLPCSRFWMSQSNPPYAELNLPNTRQGSVANSDIIETP